MNPVSCFQALRNNLLKDLYLITSLQGHMDAVLCVDFDKRRLISGGLDHTVRIWDIRSGRSIHKLYGHKVILIACPNIVMNEAV